ncbi:MULTISPECIES: type II toxin-antitoxin system Phd/YefM family antitoxin [unclassified Nocardia]|uniref:type II toxin-antitoxin system Phd/YefM family antitoxin n=1 Tax=unclassified Nocardia TaxID=2637762 RepID=UPI001CE43CB1|nr:MULTISPECIES: type II toxin-antitoxin system prevent-host-death family antitoxin [unclassified Nocardia]
MPAEQFDIHDAETHFSRIIDRVEHGEEIVISRAGTPVAKVIPIRPMRARTGRGSLRGQLVLGRDLDSPNTNEAITAHFHGD